MSGSFVRRKTLRFPGEAFSERNEVLLEAQYLSKSPPTITSSAEEIASAPNGKRQIPRSDIRMMFVSALESGHSR
jgi:hypothetical protein